MNVLRFVHQQIFQLKWQVLASLALIMVLPLEEAVVCLYEDKGFTRSGLVMVTIWLAPLLAALIACASVQADMDERREAFWRSKPVSSHWFVTGKFLIGLILSLMIFICPLLFAWIITILFGEDIFHETRFLILSVLLISLLTYSVCFFCNVLMRTTARAWLIGLTIACFAMLIPFVLPLDVKDVYSDLFRGNGLLEAYMFVILGLIAVSFIGSLLAVQRNWRVHTQLRALLWGGAGLIFVVFMLFSRQIANTKILDEKPLPENMISHSIIKNDDRIVIGALLANDKIENYEVTARNNTIQFKTITGPSQAIIVEIAEARSSAPQFKRPEDLSLRIYPNWYDQRHRFQIDSQSYLLGFYCYYRTEEVTDDSGSVDKRNLYEKLYLRSFREIEGQRVPAASLDLSDYIHNNLSPYPTVRFTKDKAVVLLRAYILVIDIADPNVMEIVESQPIKRGNRVSIEEQIDLLPVTSIDMNDRIKLSIELRDSIQFDKTQFLYVPMKGQDHRYICISDKGIHSYDVTNRDDNTIYGRFRDERPFTILETVFGDGVWNNRHFVQDGKLYNYSVNTLMVFDVTGPRIRKLGHFERISKDYRIENINVLENGNILLMASHEKWQDGNYQRTPFLQLLKNPQ